MFLELIGIVFRGCQGKSGCDDSFDTAVISITA